MRVSNYIFYEKCWWNTVSLNTCYPNIRYHLRHFWKSQVEQNPRVMELLCKKMKSFWGQKEGFFFVDNLSKPQCFSPTWLHLLQFTLQSQKICWTNYCFISISNLTEKTIDSNFSTKNWLHYDCKFSVTPQRRNCFVSRLLKSSI